jgi:hypothetical protein
MKYKELIKSSNRDCIPDKKQHECTIIHLIHQHYPITEKHEQREELTREDWCEQKCSSWGLRNMACRIVDGIME